MSQMISYHQKIPQELLDMVDAELTHSQKRDPKLRRSKLFRQLVSEALEARRLKRELVSADSEEREALLLRKILKLEIRQ
jgi:hypothetical protein